jgi:hypothetical protein
VPLELHLELGTARLCQVLSTEEVLAAATDGPAGEGGPWRQPSATHAVVHHLLHTLVSDRNWSTFTVSLRQLHTFDALVGHLGSTVDWVQVGSRLRSHGIGKAYESYLRMARRFFDTPLPYGEPVLAPMLADLVHDRLTLWNLAADNRPSIVYRNLSWALDGEYLRARYAGSAAAGLPLGALRAWHAGAVIRRGRSESLTQASIDYW